MDDDGGGVTKLFYGPEGKLKHPYTRCKKTNLRNKSVRYRCTSYRSFQCIAKLQIVNVNGEDHYIISREHTVMCKE